MPRHIIASAGIVAGLAIAITGIAVVVPGGLSDRNSDAASTSSAGGAIADINAADLSTQLSALGEHLEAQPKDATGWALLAQGYVEQARINGDASLYARADEAIATSLAVKPADNAEALAANAALASARHEFQEALHASRQSLRINPLEDVALAIRTDALTELGRYDQALASARFMDERRPGLAATTRLAYQAELRGNATSAMRSFARASAHATGSARAFSFVHLADLERVSGDIASARVHYQQALQAAPDEPSATAGLARIAAARGNTDRAIAMARRVATASPLPEHITYLGELLLADGKRLEARAQFAVVQGTAALAEEQGVNVDLELALFLADHGNPQDALTIAQRAWRDRQTVHTADALGWALHQVGSDKAGLTKLHVATRMGFQPASFLHHLGAIEASLDKDASAQTHLRASLEADPGYSPWQRTQLKRTLQSLDVS